MKAKAAARRRRIIYEVSKRFTNGVFSSTTSRAPDIIQNARAIIIIQRWAKSTISVREARRVLLQAKKTAAKEKRTLAAARSIQRSWRRYQIAKHLHKVEEEKRILASVMITSIIRRRLAILRADKLRQERSMKIKFSNAIILQCFTRTALAKNIVAQRQERARLTAKAVTVLRRFFKAIINKNARTRTMKEKCVAIIHRWLLGIAHRRKYGRIRAATICVQKYTRGHLNRKEYAAKKRLQDEISASINQQDLAERSPPPAENDHNANDGFVCLDGLSHDNKRDTLLLLSEALARERLDQERIKSASIIQRWYRNNIEFKLAALLLTRRVRIYLLNRREKRRKLNEARNVAATRIQCAIRSYQAKLKVDFMIKNLLALTLAEAEKQFDAAWKASCIKPIKRERPKTTAPAICSQWLKIIPTSFHPPFEFVPS